MAAFALFYVSLYGNTNLLWFTQFLGAKMIAALISVNYASTTSEMVDLNYS